MKQHYSIFSLARNAPATTRTGSEAWRSPEPQAGIRRRHRRRRRARPRHRLLPRQGARHHQRRGAGEGLARRRQHRAQHDHRALQLPVGRSAHLYEHSLKLWEGLSPGAQLQRHVQPARRAQPRRTRCRTCASIARRVNAIRLNGIDAEILTPRAGRRRWCPILNCSPNARYPVLGASLQRRGGIARHDAVAWGYRARRRRARRRHHPELRSHRLPTSRAARSSACETTRGSIRAKKVGVVVAGHSQRAGRHGGLPPADREPSAAGAGVRADQAGARHGRDVGRVHVYVSQSDKGELVIGAGIDSYNSYAQRGSSAGDREHAERAGRAVPDLQPRCA